MSLNDDADINTETREFTIREWEVIAAALDAYFQTRQQAYLAALARGDARGVEETNAELATIDQIRADLE